MQITIRYGIGSIRKKILFLEIVEILSSFSSKNYKYVARPALLLPKSVFIPLLQYLNFKLEKIKSLKLNKWTDSDCLNGNLFNMNVVRSTKYVLKNDI